MIDVYDLIYIAAFIDAEGTVTLTKHTSVHRVPTVDVPNTQRSILEWIETKFPKGTISNKKVYQEHHTPSYCLTYRYDAALELLKCIIYYMKHPKKVKRARYLLANYKNVTVRNGKYSNSDLVRKWDFEEGFFLLV